MYINNPCYCILNYLINIHVLLVVHVFTWALNALYFYSKYSYDKRIWFIIFFKSPINCIYFIFQYYLLFIPEHARVYLAGGMYFPIYKYTMHKIMLQPKVATENILVVTLH